MGVKGLWRLIEDAGKPMPLESLEQKILAVDVSIWLHQAVHGFKGAGGEAVANSHLLTLFHRICKLLFYRIRPVFIFDGGVPQLKKQTMSFRRVRRQAAASRAQQVRERLLKNLLRSHAVRNALGKTGPTPSEYRVMAPPKPKQKDMFELPPLPEGVVLDADEAIVKTEKGINPTEKKSSYLKKRGYQNIHEFNLDSDEFLGLPLQQRHEILMELQDSRKDNSWATINEMPVDYDDFSSFQMKRLLKRSKFQETIDGVRSNIQKIKSEELERELFGNLEKLVSQTHRIASEDAAHSILVELKRKELEPLEDKDQDEIKASKEEKGKSIMKRPPKDFLTELVTRGVIANSDDSDSDLDIDMEKIIVKQENDIDSDSLLKVMNYVMEDENGISQDEILSIIQQSTEEVDKLLHIKSDPDQPTTSRNASGIIATESSDSESDDTDDFIEVPPAEDIELNSSTQSNENDNSKNIDALLSSNSNSLYIKIVQQRLDDVIHTSEVSPKKAIIDSRKCPKPDIEQILKSPERRPLESIVKNKKQKQPELEIVIDPNSSNKVDDLFSDIFNTKTNTNRPASSFKRNSKKITSKQSDDIVSLPTPKAIESRPSSEQHTSSHKESELQLKVNQLVKEQVEKMLRESSIPLNNSNISKVNNQRQNNIGVKEPSDVEFMSSSDDEEEAVDNPQPVSSPEETVPKDLLTETSKNVCLENNSTNINENKAASQSVCSSSYSDDIPNKSSDDEKSQAVEIDSLIISPSSSSSGTVGTSSFGENSTVTSMINDGNSPSINSGDKVTASQTNVDEPLTSSDDIADVPPVVDVPPVDAPTNDELKTMEKELASEQQSLIAQVNKSDRVASNLTEQSYTDAQDLLQLFGLPFLVAPMEAEAQCAFLDSIGLTHGTITDDSDAFLFGSKNIYKNFFNQSKHVEYYNCFNVENKFGLDREKLICIALLTGSDYTEGIEKVGAVTGMEILAEFPGKGIEILKNFSKWWHKNCGTISAHKMSKVREKLVKLNVPEGFPNEEVFSAYTQPTVDESREKFEWSVPNISALREFTGEKFGWSRLKTDEILLPVLKRLKINSTQTRIDNYFHGLTLTKEPTFTSKRLKDAIAKSRNEPMASVEKTSKNFVDTIREQHTKKSKTSKQDKSIDIPESKQRRTSRKREAGASCSEASSSKIAKTADECVDEPAPKPILSKEELKLQNYKNLYKKDQIMQRKADAADMLARKQKAAAILKNKSK